MINMLDDIPELKAPAGKFRIVGVDKFEIPGEGHFVVGDYDSLDDAIKAAKEMFSDASKDSTDEDISTVYYVYDENGSWKGPK